jgi:hypothetical protein
MAFTTKELVIVNQKVDSRAIPQSNELDISELEFLLSVLKNVDIKGYQVEMFYNLAVKLQSQYLKNQNK